MILGINTAEAIHELALLREAEDFKKTKKLILLAEKRWTDERNDVDNLVPHLKTLLEEHGLSKEEIREIVVVKGPGSFTSLRTGVAFANALAEGLGAKLYSLDTFELLKRKTALSDPTLVILHAGGLDVGARRQMHSTHEPIRIGPIAHILNDYPHGKNLHVVAELTETQDEELSPILLEKGWKKVEGHELQTLGEMLATFGLKRLELAETVEPFYLKGANITKSSDPQANPKGLLSKNVAQATPQADPKGTLSKAKALLKSKKHGTGHNLI